MKKDNMVPIMEELLKSCDDCDDRETCEARRNLKIIINTGKEIDLATLNFRKKTQKIINVETLILGLWFIITLVFKIPPSTFSLLSLIGALFLLALYGIRIRQKYQKDQFSRLKTLGDALGIPREKQEEIERYIDGKPTRIAEKMTNCGLRKKYGSNYCVKCPESYKCASG